MERMRVSPRRPKRVDPAEAAIRANPAHYNVVVYAPRRPDEAIRRMTYHVSGIKSFVEATAIARDVSTLDGVRSTMIYAVAPTGRYADVGTFIRGEWRASA